MEDLFYRKPAPKRYHPAMVTLHWLIALLVLSQAIMGVGILHFWPNTAVKVMPLTIHMIVGIATFVLLLALLVGHFVLPRPAPVNAGNPFLHFVSKSTHFLLYLFALLMGGSGILLALQSHVLQLVVGGRVSLPMYFNLFLHAAIFVMFGMLVGFHVLAALYHQFVLRDRLFTRMGLDGKRQREERRLVTVRRPAGTT